MFKIDIKPNVSTLEKQSLGAQGLLQAKHVTGQMHGGSRIFFKEKSRSR